MRKFFAMIFAAALSSQVFAATCNVNDVSIEGVTASSCTGMMTGNFSKLQHINAVSDVDFDYVSTTYEFGTDGTFSFSDLAATTMAVALKQNTHWAVYYFDLSKLVAGSDGVWDGTWSTKSMSWDRRPDRRGCQGCGGLSHGMVVGFQEVPVPGTLGLLGIGLVGLSMLRRNRSAELQIA